LTKEEVLAVVILNFPPSRLREGSGAELMRGRWRGRYAFPQPLPQAGGELG